MIKYLSRFIYVNLFFFIVTFFLNAQEKNDSADAVRLIHLGDIVVTSERTPVQNYLSGRLIKVITADEIKNLPVQSLADMLEYQSGMDVRQRGANGLQSDISIRGSTFDQTLILLNGININDPQTGHHNMNIPVDVCDIKRIEILEGPGSRSFGNNAFGGVVNIITAEAEKQAASFNFSAGDFGFIKTGLNAALPAGIFRNYLSISHHRSKGYIENTGYSVTNLYYNNRLVTESVRLEFQAGLSARDFGANSFYTPAFPEQFEQLRTMLASVLMKYNKGKSDITAYLCWRRNRDKFALFRNLKPAWYKNDNFHLSHAAGGGFNISHTFPVGILSAGAEIRYENILSNILGEKLFKTVRIPWNDTVRFTHGFARLHAGTFAQYSFATGKFHFSAGTMFAFNTGYSSKPGLYPGVDISWRFSENIIWSGAVNRALRQPTFTDLFYSSPVLKGNINLLPEQATSVESGLRYLTQRLKAHLSVSRRMGTGLIDWVKYPYDTLWQAMNHTRVNVNGLEMLVEWKSGIAEERKSFFETIEFACSFFEADRSSGEMQSRYVLDQLRQRIDLGTDIRIARSVITTWYLRYQQRAGGYQPFENNRYLPEVPYDKVFLFDGKITWRVGPAVIYAEATNILNLKYSDYANVPEPGRWIKTGIRFDMQLHNGDKKELRAGH